MGPTGLQGATGPTGDRGPQGETGPAQDVEAVEPVGAYDPNETLIVTALKYDPGSKRLQYVLEVLKQLTDLYYSPI